MRVFPFNLRHKITTVLLVLTLVPVGLVTLISVQVMTRQLESMLVQDVETTMALVQTLIKDSQRELRFLSTILSADTGVQVELSLGNVEELHELLVEKQQLYDVRGVLVTDADGRIVAQTGTSYSPGTNLSNTSVFGKALASDGPIAGLSQEAGQFVIKGASPISLKNGTLVGFSEVSRVIDELFLRQLKNISGANLSLFVGGDLSATTVHDPAGSRRATGSARRELSEAASIDVVRTVPLQDVDGRLLGRLEISVSRAPTRDAQMQVASVMLGGGVAMLVLAVVLGVLLARGITRPLTVLVEATKRVAQGDFSRQVPVTTADELGLVGGAFNQMAVEIQQLMVTEREKEARFRNIFEHSHDSIFVLDPPQDKIIDANPRASQLLGYTREELLALPISAIHPKERDKLSAFMRTVSTHGTGWTDELTCVTKAGKVIPCEVSAAPIEIAGKAYVVAFVRDITERKRAEERERELAMATVAAKTDRAKAEELARINQIMMGREERILELKGDVNALLEELGRPKKHDST